MLLKRFYRRLFPNKSAIFNEGQDRLAILMATVQAQSNRKLTYLNELADVEFSAFSQWGEDGIIDWLISRLPDIPKTFIEFGVENYHESNTRLLLQLRNWRGLVIDGCDQNVREIRQQSIYWRHGLTAKCAFVTRENINLLIQESGIVGEIGLLSIDIDGNDYWVWQAIEVVSPAIVVIEYNAVLGDLQALTVPYHPEFQRTRAHHSNLYFGASLPALLDLAREKGFQFVGTTSTGVNAIFVREDFASCILSALDCIWAYPSLIREARSEDGDLCFIDGAERAGHISNMPLLNVATGEETSLGEFTEIYSTLWKSGSKVAV